MTRAASIAFLIATAGCSSGVENTVIEQVGKPAQQVVIVPDAGIPRPTWERRETIERTPFLERRETDETLPPR